MSQSGIQVEKYDYFNTTYTSGDSNTKKKQLYQEENNNEVNELSKEFSEMGCIVDAVKRPPNVCVETCIYESESDDEKSHSKENDNDEVHYSDEFEEDKSEIEEAQNKPADCGNRTESVTGIQSVKSSVKLAKSQSSVSTNKPPSLSGRSSGFGSVSVPQTRRINMSFSNERLREIERHNHILLNKIMSARNVRKSSIPGRDQPATRAAPASVHRKQQQRRIDHDNMILLKKIQRAKSSACSVRR